MIRPLVVFLLTGVAVAGAAVSYVALQEDPPETTKGPQEIKKTLHSWYQILQGDDHVGYSHMRLNPVDLAEWKYEMESLTDAEIQVNDQYLLLSAKVSAKLDKDFDPVDVQGTVSVQGIAINVRMRRTDSGSTIEVSGSGLDPVILPIEDTENLVTDLYLALFRLKQSGIIDKGGVVDVRMLNSIDPAEPRGQSMQLTVMRNEVRTYLGKEATVTRIEVTGYPSDLPDGQIETVWIDGFGRVVEMETAGSLHMVLVRDSKEAKGDRQRVSADGRRDPFDKGIAMGRKGSESKDPNEVVIKDKPPIPIGKEREALEKAAEMVADLKKLKESGAQAQLKDKYDAFIYFFRFLRNMLLKNPDMAQELARLDTLKREAETYFAGAQHVLEEANQLLILAGRHAANAKCDRVSDQVKEMQKLRSRPELIGSSELLELEREYIDVARKMLEKCQIREQLRAKKIVLTGTIDYTKQVAAPIDIGLDVLGHRVAIKRPATLVHTETYALINGDAYRVNDMIRNQDVRLDEITRFGIRVSYRGESRDVPIQ